MTVQSNSSMNDLILRVAGGHRDGELIPVKTKKCFLGFEESSDQGVVEKPKCAIFRGPNGTAVKSYADDVSVNGVASTVHWLKEGDRIEFPNSMTVEVAQLGWLEHACEEIGAAGEETVESEFDCVPTDEDASQTHGDEPSGWEADHQMDSEPADTTEPETTVYANQSITENHSPNQNDVRIDLIESRIKDIQSQISVSQQRFDNLDEQLSSLFEQVGKLSSIFDGKSAFPEQEEESFITQGNTDQFSGLSQSEDVFMHEKSADLNEQGSDDEINDLASAGDFYSHLDDDDEKIIRFDPESETDHVEASAENVEITDAPPELCSFNEGEIDSRLSEMERVFGGELAETVLETTESTKEQTADEQPLESFESPTHGPDEGSDSFADHTTTCEGEPLEPGSLAEQLLNEVESDESSEPKVEQVVEEPVAVAEPVNQSTSSVADLLARMKAEGQWDGIPDSDEIVEPEPEPVVAAPVEPIDAAEPEGDVEDYMSQLLNRMRGGEPASEAKPVVAKPTPSKPKAEEETEKAEFVPPENPLKPDEFKPARKAQKIELSAMRELANSTSRSAVNASEKIRRKELGYVQIGIAVCSFFMAIYYFLVNSTQFMDTGFFLGLICTGIAGFLGFRFYTTIRYNEMMEVLTQKESNHKLDKVEAVASAEPAAEQD